MSASDDLISKTSSELGREFPKFDQIECSEKLTVLCQVGKGATSTVYSTKLGEVEGVVKVMKNGFEHLAGHEKQILDQLELAGVPGLMKSTKILHGVLFSMDSCNLSLELLWSIMLLIF